MLDINKLRELAEAATQGPWTTESSATFRDEQFRAITSDGPMDWLPRVRALAHPEADAAYIAYAHPTHILELLAELESRDEQIEDLREHVSYWELRTHRAEDEAEASDLRSRWEK